MGRSLVVVLVVLAACGDDAVSAGDAGSEGGAQVPDGGGAGTTGATPPTSDAGRCGDFGASDVCASCLARECCGLAQACAEDDECGALVDCTRVCGDADAGDCRQACIDDHGSGRAAYNELVLCMGQRCRAECPFDTP